MAEARHGELAAFLRAHRARLRPADVGLPPGPGRRRTPGLRREEVAQLSGVGLTWYTWLEQGRRIPASAQVVDALARALRLDPDRHRHLRGLAGLPAVAAAVPLPAERLQRLVDSVAPNPAAVYDAHYDYVAWNEPYVRVRHDPGRAAPGRRNWVWLLFTDAAVRARMPGWEAAARAVLGQFRAAAGQGGHDPRFAELVAALQAASPQFRAWWADYPVREFRPAVITVAHPQAGPIALELFQLRPAEHPDALLVVQVPATGDDRRRVGLLLG